MLREVNTTQDRLILISFVWQRFFLFYFHSGPQLELSMFKCHYEQGKTALEPSKEGSKYSVVRNTGSRHGKESEKHYAVGHCWHKKQRREETKTYTVLKRSSILRCAPPLPNHPQEDEGSSCPHGRQWAGQMVGSHSMGPGPTTTGSSTAFHLLWMKED